MHVFLTWIQHTWPGEFVRAYSWVFPTLESLHFLGMSLLIGVVGIIDLRVLGVARNLPIGPLHKLLPFAFVGFGINLISGIMFFAADPGAYAFNLAFRLKLLCILLAGLNALWFRLGVFLDVDKWGAGIEASPLAKLISGLSLLLWAGVIIGGRFIPFVPDVGS
jgi:hypothetical protein